MPGKRKPPPDDPEESKRFIDMTREVGAEQPSPDFERVFRKVAEQPKGQPTKRGSRTAQKRSFRIEGVPFKLLAPVPSVPGWFCHRGADVPS